VSGAGLTETLNCADPLPGRETEVLETLLTLSQLLTVAGVVGTAVTVAVVAAPEFVRVTVWLGGANELLDVENDSDPGLALNVPVLVPFPFNVTETLIDAVAPPPGDVMLIVSEYVPAG
jgi:hypothetical protein